MPEKDKILETLQEIENRLREWNKSSRVIKIEVNKCGVVLFTVQVKFDMPVMAKGVSHAGR